MQPSRTATTLRLAISEPQRVNGPQMGPRPQVAVPQRSSTTSRESDSGLGRGAPQAHTPHGGTPTHALLQLESPTRHPRRTPTATPQPPPTNSPRHWPDFRHTPPRPAGAWTYFAELRPRGSELRDGGQQGSEAFVEKRQLDPGFSASATWPRPGRAPTGAAILDHGRTGRRGAPSVPASRDGWESGRAIGKVEGLVGPCGSALVSPGWRLNRSKTVRRKSLSVSRQEN